MARKGPPPLPPNVVNLRGTARSDRQRAPVLIPVQGEPNRPKYLNAKQRRKFDELVDKFQRRGQQVVGLEDMMAVYACELVRWEQDIKRGVPWTASEKNALRGLAIQFYDTAATQIAPGGSPSSNPFAGNGKRPPDSA